MLKSNSAYKNNAGSEVLIIGQIKDYSSKMPYVWSIQAWYDEKSGALVTWTRDKGYSLLSTNCAYSISNHTEL